MENTENQETEINQESNAENININETSKTEESETEPLIDFKQADLAEAFDYETEVTKWKKVFTIRLVQNIMLILLGILLIVCCTKTKYLGVVYFIGAFFYCFPIGIAKTIAYIHRIIHVRDYVSHPEYVKQVDVKYFVKKIFKKNKKDDQE